MFLDLGTQFLDLEEFCLWYLCCLCCWVRLEMIFFFFECKSGATVFRKHEIRSPGYLTDCSHEHRGNQQYTKVGVRTDSVLGGKRCLAPEEGQHCERDSQTWKETVRGNRSIQGAKRQGLNHEQKAKTASSAHAIEVPYKFRQHRQSPFGSFWSTWSALLLTGNLKNRWSNMWMWTPICNYSFKICHINISCLPYFMLIKYLVGYPIKAATLNNK